MISANIQPFARPWRGIPEWLLRNWFVAIAAMIFVSPGLYGLATREWSTEQGAAGPIILTSGLWLLRRECRLLLPIEAQWPAMLPYALVLATALAGYLISSIVGMLWLIWLSTYLTLVIIASSYIGLRNLARLWFPLAYLMFLVPPPYTLIATITQSRKLWLSQTSISFLSSMGYEVASSGTSMYIDQYEMLIADACAGMNSLVSLLAVGLFYIYVMHRADWRYATVLALATVPVAMIANLARILLLLLAAHYFGADIALGPVHELAGVIMFVVALSCVLGVDTLLTLFRRLVENSSTNIPG